MKRSRQQSALERRQADVERWNNALTNAPDSKKDAIKEKIKTAKTDVKNLKRNLGIG
jgi:hypothetical protein